MAYQIIDDTQKFLSDGKEFSSVTFVDTNNPTVYLYESFMLDTQANSETAGKYLCWQNTDPNAPTNVDETDYRQPNINGAIPSPKGSKNPGGSPIKY